MNIPDVFCWTRFGTEAGEPIEAIFVRKEDERRANGGVFLWGVGNSIRPSVVALTAERRDVAAVFSPMISKPSVRDVAPERTVLWTAAEALDGTPCEIPAGSIVTSALRSSRPRQHHYALVCRSDMPLDRNCTSDSLRLHDLRNYRKGTKIGASQVTCVVRRAPSDCECGPVYRVAMSVDLVWPYFVQLADPVTVPDDIRQLGENDTQSSTMRQRLLELRDRASRPAQRVLSFSGAE